MKTILIIEDDPSDIRAVRKALDLPGNELVVVSSGDEADEFFQKRGKFEAYSGGQPALVILDMHLPGKSGIEILSEMRQHPDLAASRVIVLSGSRDEYHVLEAHQLGVDAYIVKPIVADRLVDSLRNAWSQLFHVQ